MTFVQKLVESLDGALLREPAGTAGDYVIAIEGVETVLSGPLPPIGDLTDSQRTLADYVLGNLADCAFIPAAELGRRCGVSESTVVRFASAVGFSGFPQFQEVLQSQVKHRLSIAARVERVASELRIEENVASHVYRADLDNLTRTYESLVPDDFERAVAILTSARRIYALGLRTSAPLAGLFAIAMRYLGREVVQLDLGVGDYWERLDFITPEDAMFAVSFRHYTAWTQEILEWTFGQGVPTVVITDGSFSPPTDFATVSLAVQRNLHTLIESSTAPMSLINALVMGIALADKESSIAALKSRERLWHERHIYLKSRRSVPKGGGEDPS